MPEDDPISTIEGAPKRLAEFLLELYKVMRDQKQQQQQQAAAQQQQEAMQRQNQAFMTEQNERLMDVMRESGIPSTDATRDLAKSGLNRIERLAETEVQTEKQIKDLDKQISDIDNQQKALLAPPPDPIEQQKKLTGVDDRLKFIESEKTKANDFVKQQEQSLKKANPGITPEKLQEGMKPYEQMRDQIVSGIETEKADLLKQKTDLEPVDPVKVKSDLADLDKAQLKADTDYKADMQKLMDNPDMGQNPDKLFEGMEKLKTDKAALDKDLAQKRDGLNAKQNPKTPLTPGEKADELQKLHEKKAGLLKQKEPLKEKMKGIESQKAELSKGNGMEAPGQKTNWSAFKSRLSKSEFGVGIKGESVGKAFFMGGFDLLKKSIQNPNSTAASLYNQASETTKANSQKLGQDVSTKVKLGK